MESTADPCHYLKDTEAGRVLILIYVDDFIIASPKPEIRKELELRFEKEFEITTLGVAKRYLGINIEGNKSKGTISVNVKHT